MYFSLGTGQVSAKGPSWDTEHGCKGIQKGRVARAGGSQAFAIVPFSLLMRSMWQRFEGHFSPFVYL